MIKKKGIYIEKIPYGNAFFIIYYDGEYLLLVPFKYTHEYALYKKYSGTTFIDVENWKRTTITKIINLFCPFGVNYICKDIEDFPLIDINNIFKEAIENENKRNNQAN